MKDSLYRVFRHGLDILCIFMISITAIVIYGTAKRSEHYIPIEEIMISGIDAYGGEIENIYSVEEDCEIDKVIDFIIQVENPMLDIDAVGDQHLKNKAYGLLQIRQPYLDDVNRIAGTDYVIEDMKDSGLARWAAKVYLDYYGSRYEKKTGKTPTPEVYGRIHNGGPNGWMKESTNGYAVKMGRIISKGE